MSEARPQSPELPPLARVRKRDGRLVPFDAHKIERAVAQALAAAGESDAAFASEVAQVVDLALRRRALESRGAPGASAGDSAGWVPGIEEIQDLVERALIELGRAAVAKAYILYRDRRAQVRDVLQVREAHGPRAPMVDAAHSLRAWSKARIAAALMEEARLPRATAEEVAARCERRVLDLGLARLSTGLVRELVDNELFELGLTDALKRQEALKLPRHDLRALLAGESLDPWSRGGRGGARRGERAAREQALASAGGALLLRYALEDVLPPSAADAHLAGWLHFEDLRQPHLPLWTALPAVLLGAPAAAASGEPAFAALAEIGAALGECTRGLVIEEPHALLAPLLRGNRSESLSAWLEAAGALAGSHARTLGLAGFGARHAGLLARLIELAAATPRAADFPRLYVSGEELELVLASGGPLLASADEALRRELLVPCFQPAGERGLGPAGLRSPDLPGALSNACAVALHLPKLARRVGPWREEALFEALFELLPAALAGARALIEFQRQAAAGRGRTHASAWAALVPVGFREALALCNGGEVDPQQGARWLGFLSEAAARLQGPGDCRLALSTFDGERGAQRFAWLDARERRAAGPELFPEAEREPPVPAYSSGYALGALPGWWPGEAEADCYASLAAGAFARADDERADMRASALDAWRRFRALRLRAEGHKSGLLFPLAPRAAQPSESEPDEAPSALARAGQADPAPGANARNTRSARDS